MTSVTDKEFLILMARSFHKDYEEFKLLRQLYEDRLEDAKSLKLASGVEDAVRDARLAELVHSFQSREGMAMKTYGRICHHFAQNGVTWESEGPTLDDRY